MNVFAGDRTKVGQSKAQFATFFAKKRARKDNRLLCMLRYGFVIKAGLLGLFWNYILIQALNVNFYLSFIKLSGAAFFMAAGGIFCGASSSYILRNIRLFRSQTTRAAGCDRD